MRKTRAEVHDPQRSPPPPTAVPSCPHRGELLDRFLLFVLLALIPVRTVASETRAFELARWLRLLEAPTGAGPATTFTFFAVILTVATIVLCVRPWQGSRCRWTGLEAGIGLFVVAATVSTLRAGQKHLALAGSLDLLGLLLYCVALRQLLTRPWHLRLTLTVILATGAVVVTKCAHQRLYELPATIEYYQEHKSELIGGPTDGMDVSLRPGALHDYEQRLKAMTASGYVQHPNILAGYLILVVMTALAVAAGRLKRRLPMSAVAPLLLAIAGGVTFVWTQSKGAAAACALAGLVWLVGGWLVRRCPTARHVRLVIAFWAALMVGGASLVTLLKAEPEALGRSMLFRSMYWQGAWRMLVEQGPWGVGADNFGRFFTRYKSVECPEEVDDPHSWVVKAACEHGVIGLAAVLMVFVGFSWRLARRGEVSGAALREGGAGERPRSLALTGLREGKSRVGQAEPAQQAGSIILWMGGLGVALLVGWLGLCAGADINYVLFTLAVVLMPWLLGFVALALEGATDTSFSDKAVPAALGGICAGLVGFLLHAGIDLPLFHPGASLTFFALMAVAAALREQADAAPAAPALLETPARVAGDRACSLAGASGRLDRPCTTRLRVGLGVVGVISVVVVSLSLVYPSARLAALLEQARREAAFPATTRPDTSHIWRTYRAAANSYSLDATAVGEWIEELSKGLDEPTKADLPLSLAEEFRRRDPFNSGYWHYVAGLHWTKFRLGRDAADMSKAVGAMREAVAAYPTSPSRRLRLADLLQELAEADGSSNTRWSAAVELQAALDLDAKRVYISKPHRLTEEQRAAIAARIEELRR